MWRSTLFILLLLVISYFSTIPPTAAGPIELDYDTLFALYNTTSDVVDFSNYTIATNQTFNSSCNNVTTDPGCDYVVTIPGPVAPAAAAAVIQKGYAADASQFLNNIQSFTTTWFVPPAPTTNDNQVIFLFNGLQNYFANNKTWGILQPVLQWNQQGGRNKWTIQCYYVYGGNATNPSYIYLRQPATPIVVQPCTLLTGYMALVGTNGAGGFSYSCEFFGYPTTKITITNVPVMSYIMDANLETYGIVAGGGVQKASDYPSCGVHWSNISVTSSSPPPQYPNLNWKVSGYSKANKLGLGETVLNVNNNNPGGSMDLIFGTNMPLCNCQGSSSSTGGGRSSTPAPSGVSTGASCPGPQCSSVSGDPKFVGLLGQQYQVHGIDGQVYSLILAEDIIVNGRFVFLSGGKCPAHDVRKAHCWTHPGSYIGEIGILTGNGDELIIISGDATKGFDDVVVNHRTIAPFTSVQTTNEFGFNYLSNYSLIVNVGNFELTFENSDRFINLLHVKVNSWKRLKEAETHGLLGQTWRHTNRKDSPIVGTIDMYAEENNELLGEDFDLPAFEN